MKHWLKKSMAVLGVVVMLLTMLPMGIFALAETEGFDVPDGYTLQPISTEAELAAVKTGSAPQKVYYYLTNDITVTAAGFGIGTHESTDGFWDIFDGNGYAITFAGPEGNGVNLSKTNANWDGGLFIGLNKGAVIKNLTTKGKATSTAQSSGVLVGRMLNGRIDNCVNYADFTSTNHATGGIAGRMNYGVIVNCQNYGNVTGKQFTGGLVGKSDYNTLPTEAEKTAGVVRAIIANSANHGAVVGTDKTGGIIGLADKDCTYRVENCYNTGSVTMPSVSNPLTMGAIVCSAWPAAVVVNNVYAQTGSCVKMLKATTQMTADDMTAAGFTATLNANIAGGIAYQDTLNGTAINVPAVNWVQDTETGYPVIPAATPIDPTDNGGEDPDDPPSDLTDEEQMALICDKLTAYFMENDSFYDGANNGKCYTSKAGDYLAIQNEDGSWDDVDYYCTQSAANGGVWEAYLALDRVQAMAMAYAKEGGQWYHDPAMLQGVENFFTHWASIRDANPEKDDYEGPWSTNWWENGNGPQLRFGRIGVVLQGEISDFAKGVMLRKLDKNGATGSGQNALWATQNAVYRALIDQDPVQLRKVINECLAVNLRVGGLNDEAVQVDNTFHCHGNQLYTNGYGKMLFRDMSFWIDTLAGTGFDLPQEVIELMGHYMLDGTRWMIRGNLLEAADGYKGGSAADYIIPIQRMIKNDPARAAEYQMLLDSITGDSESTYNGANGNYYMWTSALMSQQRENYGLNVRTVNNTMKGSEYRATWPNTDFGNQIYWTSSSTTTVMVDGDEYLSVYPAYDWAHIPGVTSPNRVSLFYGFDNGQTDTFGASDGQNGTLAYVFNQHDNAKESNKRVSGKISKFFFDEAYVALGSDITSNHGNAIHSTLNQTKSGGDVTVDGVAVADGTENATYTPGYVYNNKIGYIFPNETEVHLSNLNHTGKYPSVYGLGYSNTTEDVYGKADDSVFTLWIDHGVAPQDASYSYIVMPGATEAEVAAYTASNPITIIANTDKVQAVYHSGLKQTQINFFEAGSLEYAAGKTVTVDGPCSLIIDDSKDETTITAGVSNTTPAVNLNVKLNTEDGESTTRFCALEEPYAGKPITLAEGGSSLTQSSATTAGNAIHNAFDGDETTYFEAVEATAWISNDLQKIQYIGNMTVTWGDSYATAYELQYSEDGVNWTTAYTQTAGQGGVEVIPYNTIGRYWKLNITATSEGGAQIKEIDFTPLDNIALNRPADSNYIGTSNLPSAAVDGDAATRWSGQRSFQNNWLSVNLGANADLEGVRILWEAAYAKEYIIDVSSDGVNWTMVKTVTGSDGGTDQTSLPAGTKGRYLRVKCLDAALIQYGISIWELEVYGFIDMTAAADKSALELALSRKVMEEVYTEDSLKAYNDAYTAAKEIFDLLDATAEQVDKATADLNAAYDALTVRDLGDVLATLPDTSVSAGDRQTLQINWSNLSNTVDLSEEDLDKIYFFAIVDIETEQTKSNMFSSGRILLRSPNTPKAEGGTQENNAWVHTGNILTSTGRNVVYIPLSLLSNQTGTMDWSQVQTTRLYIDSMNQLEGNKSMKISHFQIVRTNEPTVVKVACVGDSITAGNGSSSSANNYPSQLQKLLGTKRFNVQNFGNSGKTLLTVGGTNDYTATNEYKNSQAFQPDVVIIMLGTNDSKNGDNYWATHGKNFEKELRELVDVYRNLESKPIVMIATSPTAYNTNWTIQPTTIHDEIAPIQRKVAEDMGCPLVEIHDNTVNMADKFADGIHPNDAGYAVLADLFADAIIEASTRVYGLTVGENTATVDEANSTIALTVDTDTDLDALELTWSLMAGATVTPTVDVDYSKPVAFTVTGADGIATREYTLTVTKQGASIPVADKAALNTAIAEADKITDLSGYTDESAKAFTDALAAAKAVAGKADASQTEVDAAKAALVAAQDGLTEKEPEIMLGDINGNGAVTAEDALLALQIATNKVTPSTDQLKTADVDGKSGVTANDALLILQFVTKKISNF